VTQDTQDALFARGDLGEQASVGPVDHTEFEHQQLPEAVRKERRPTLTLSFESEEDRDRLAELLGSRIVRRGAGPWETTWPDAEPDADALFAFGEDAV
jgi:hypothetical protein